MLCDGSPDPTIACEINAYISLWKEDEMRVQVNEVLHDALLCLSVWEIHYSISTKLSAARATVLDVRAADPRAGGRDRRHARMRREREAARALQADGVRVAGGARGEARPRLARGAPARHWMARRRDVQSAARVPECGRAALRRALPMGQPHAQHAVSGSLYLLNILVFAHGVLKCPSHLVQLAGHLHAASSCTNSSRRAWASRWVASSRSATAQCECSSRASTTCRRDASPTSRAASLPVPVSYLLFHSYWVTRNIVQHSRTLRRRLMHLRFTS